MREISDFTSEWPGGYFEGDPRDPFASSSYLSLGYISVLHATYLACIKPHVTNDTTVLEIGPGRGAWTKAILELSPKAIWAVDAASDEHSGFSDYVGQSPRVRHRQISDESLSIVPDGEVNFFFSFGVFCHLPESIVSNYLVSLSSKMSPGAHGYFMVADFDQHDFHVRHNDALDHLFALRRFAVERIVHRTMTSLFPHKLKGGLRHKDPGQGASQWYNIGKERASEIAGAAGFNVVERDVGTCPRDPIIHIVRP